MAGVGVVAGIVCDKVYNLLIVFQVGVAVPLRNITKAPSVTRPLVKDFPAYHGLACRVQRLEDGGVGGALGELKGWGRL